MTGANPNPARPAASHAGENPFVLLRLPATMRISAAEIESAYLRAVARTHPDMGSGAASPTAMGEPPAEALNRARATLLDAESRANALLAAHGGPSAAADKSLPPTFLMEVMELRSASEGAIATRDAEALHAHIEAATALRAQFERAVTTLLDRTDSTALRTSMRDARTQLNAWRYIERLLEQLHAAAGED